jgi:hypothetical protein
VELEHFSPGRKFSWYNLYSSSFRDWNNNYAGLDIPDPDGSGPCTATSDAVTITVNNPAPANAGSDKSTCGNTPVTLGATAAQGGNWTGGAGTFFPGRNAANANLHSCSIGKRIICLTYLEYLRPRWAGPCLSSSDGMIITITATATLMPEQTDYMCNDPVTLGP